MTCELFSSRNQTKFVTETIFLQQINASFLSSRTVIYGPLQGYADLLYLSFLYKFLIHNPKYNHANLHFFGAENVNIEHLNLKRILNNKLKF